MDFIYASIYNILEDAKCIQAACFRIVIEDNERTAFTPKAIHIIRNTKMEIRLIFQHWGSTTSAVIQIEQAIGKVRSILNGSEEGCFEYSSGSLASAGEMSLAQFCTYALSITIDALVISKAVILSQNNTITTYPLFYN